MTEPLTLGRLFTILRRYWLLIALVTIAAAAAAFLATQAVDKTWTATNTQLVKASPGKGATANYEGAQYAANRAKSYPNLIYNSSVLDAVRTDLGGTESLADLREDLTAANPEETALVEITATAGSALEAQRKADSAALHLGNFITQIEAIPGQSPITVETAVYAAQPESPTSPQVPVIVAVGAFAGLALGLLLALALSHRSAVSAERRRGQQPAAGWWDGTSSSHDVATPLAGDRAANTAAVNGGHVAARPPVAVAGHRSRQPVVADGRRRTSEELVADGRTGSSAATHERPVTRVARG